MTLDPVRVLRFAGIAIWAAFFHWLWWGGDAALFVGRRTEWVVPFGALTTSLVAVAYAFTLRATGSVRPPALADLAGTTALVLPVIAVMVVPSPTLGVFAAERKGEVDVSLLAKPERRGANEPVLIAEMAIASEDAGFASERQIKPGLPAEIEGLVTEIDTDTNRVVIARFQLGCCAADALPFGVSVRLPAELELPAEGGEWMRALGKVVRAPDGGLEVLAAELFATPRPSQPYL